MKIKYQKSRKEIALEYLFSGDLFVYDYTVFIKTNMVRRKRNGIYHCECIDLYEGFAKWIELSKTVEEFYAELVEI